MEFIDLCTWRGDTWRELGVQVCIEGVCVLPNQQGCGSIQIARASSEVWIE